MAGCAGIDVAKDHLDWTLDSGGEVRQVLNTPAGVRRVVRKMQSLEMQSLELDRVVLEATGGYEKLLFQALSYAGVPVVRINPKRARDFGQGMGVLAKNDAIDARLLALYGAKAEPKLIPGSKRAGTPDERPCGPSETAHPADHDGEEPPGADAPLALRRSGKPHPDPRESG